MRLIRSLLIWIVSVNLFVIFRFAGHDELTVNWLEVFTGATIASLVMGLLFYLINSVLEKPRFRRRTFFDLVVVQVLFFFLSIFIVTVITVVIIDIFFYEGTWDEILFTLQDILTSTDTILYIVFALIISMLFYYNSQMAKKIGPGRLINLLMGKYHSPKMEEKIVMFLDLRSATAIAEKLDAFRYSSFLQDFFFDLDIAIQRTSGMIYQFVGDEIVIMWDLKKGVEHNNCLRFFFIAEDIIQQARGRYLEKYGILPEFKAGIHLGPTVVAEVGHSKQEIAYHGDTINTAARIRSQCSELGCNLLISSDVLSHLSWFDEDFHIKSAGVFSLKGKQNVVGLVTVERKSPNIQMR